MGNRHSPTVIIAAITGKAQTKAKLPTHTEIKNFKGLDRDSIILLEQIWTIDKQRLREYLGTLDGRYLLAMDKALAISIGLNGHSQCSIKKANIPLLYVLVNTVRFMMIAFKKRISPLAIWYKH